MRRTQLIGPSRLGILAALTMLPLMLGNDGCGSTPGASEELCEGGTAFCPGGRACTLEYAPVCGVDGRTYGNACHANISNVEIAYVGECHDKVCGGLLGIECPRGQFCDYAEGTQCGAGDQTGICRVPPQACPEHYSPVCGCDGETYGNSCEAAAAGVSVLHSGACGFVGDTCGGIIGAGCPDGQFCDFPASTQCGSGDQQGTCRVPPDACTAHYDPVCGCDGNTYGNACNAASAGVSVLHDGACESSTRVCGGLLGIECPSTQFCDFPIETMCGSGDQQGVCRTPPGPCTEEYQPVCGCDGKTYSNACHAAAARQSVVHVGACQSSTNP